MLQHMDGLAVSSANKNEKNKKDIKNKAMVDKEVEAGATAETWKQVPMEASVEEAQVMVVMEVVEEVAAVEEAKEATATTTIQEELQLRQRHQRV